MEEFDKFVNDNTQFLDNPYTSGTLMVFLIVYSSSFASRLPPNILKLFDYTLVKLVMLFLIVFISRKNVTVALFLAIALIVSIMALNRAKFDNEMMSVVTNSQKSTRQLQLGNCSCTCDGFEEIMPKTSEGKLVVAETQNAVAKGALSPVVAEKLAKKIVNAENIGKPVLVAKTEEGAKRMEEIAQNVSGGKLSEEEGKKKAAIVVVAEAVMESKQITKSETSSKLPLTETKSSQISGQNMAEMAEEVLKRKQEETLRRGGVPPSNEELKQMCASVLNDFRRTTSCENKKSSADSYDVTGVDPTASDYQSVGRQ